MNVTYFCCHQINELEKSTIFKAETGIFFSEAIIFNNGHLEIVGIFPKNNNPNISVYFLIVAKFIFVLYS